MKIEFDIQKKHFYIIIAIITLFGGLISVAAFQSGLPPSVAGHDASEIGGGTFDTGNFTVNGSSGVTSFTGATRLGLLLSGSTSTNDYSGVDFTGNGAGGAPTARMAVRSTSGGSLLSFGTSNNFVSGITNEALLIDQVGNVNISAGTENVPLTLISTDDASMIRFIDDSESVVVGAFGNKGFADADGGTFEMTWRNNSVGIGTEEPFNDTTLTVFGSDAQEIVIDTAAAEEGTLNFEDNGNPQWQIGKSADTSQLFFYNYDRDHNAMVISNASEVGIGPAIGTPSYTLHVQDGTTDITGLVSTIITGGDVQVLEVRFVGPNNPGGNYEFIRFTDDDAEMGRIEGTGAGGVTYGTTGGDYAEWMPREDYGEVLEKGDLVGVKNGKISKNTLGADLIMVVSKHPGVLGNTPINETGIDAGNNVAFVGQLVAKVRGPVKHGDYILPSSLNDGAGIAVSATGISFEQYKKAVGVALESSDSSEVKLVNVAVGIK